MPDTIKLLEENIGRTLCDINCSNIMDHFLEKEMATHSSILGLENPRDRGAWWAMGSHRVGHD